MLYLPVFCTRPPAIALGIRPDRDASDWPNFSDTHQTASNANGNRHKAGQSLQKRGTRAAVPNFDLPRPSKTAAEAATGGW